MFEESTTTRPESESSEKILVHIGPMGKLTSLTLDPGTYTVQDLLDRAELTVSRGYELRSGGEIVTKNTTVQNGQTVYVVKSVAGN